MNNYMTNTHYMTSCPNVTPGDRLTFGRERATCTRCNTEHPDGVSRVVVEGK